MHIRKRADYRAHIVLKHYDRAHIVPKHYDRAHIVLKHDDRAIVLRHYAAAVRTCAGFRARKFTLAPQKKANTVELRMTTFRGMLKSGVATSS